MVKGDKTSYRYVLLLPQCFQKSFPLRVVKTLDCVVKGYVTVTLWPYTFKLPRTIVHNMSYRLIPNMKGWE